MKNAKIVPCTCKHEHEYQDRVYGRNMRVMNPRIKDGEYRCTVCGVTKSFGTEKKS